MANLAEKVSDVAKEKQAPPEKRRALGRGLESLLPGGPRVVAGSAVAPATATKSGVTETAQPNTGASEASASSLNPAPPSNPAAPPLNPAPPSKPASSPAGQSPSPSNLAASQTAQTAPAGGTALTSTGSAPVSPLAEDSSPAVRSSAAVPSSQASSAAASSSPMAGLDRAVVRNEAIGAAPAKGSAAASVPEAESGGSAAGVGAVAESAGAGAAGVGPELQGAADTDFDGVEVIELPLDRIDSNPYQTRHFTEEDEADLAELAVSIKAQGLIQPITVRKGKHGRYILIAGDRRTRASRLAEKTTIPAIVWEVSEQQAAEMTIIENLMREDLNCMDQTRAFVLLSSKFHMTQAQIADRIGCSRESVSNYMRLARLPNELQDYLINGQLEFSHARLLLKIDDPAVQLRVARKVVNEHIPVYDLEDLMLASNPTLLKPVDEKKKERGARWVDPNVRSAQRELERVLGMRVRIRDRNNKGKIMIDYSTLEDFDRVVGMLKGK